MANTAKKKKLGYYQNKKAASSEKKAGFNNNKHVRAAVKAVISKKNKDGAREKVTVGGIAKAALLEGKSTVAVIAAVKSKFPDSKIGEASVNWYRGALRKDGEGKKLKKLTLGRKPAEEKKSKKVFKRPVEAVDNVIDKDKEKVKVKPFAKVSSKKPAEEKKPEASKDDMGL